MRIGLFQFSPYLCDTERNIETIQNFLTNKKFDLIVLPELANSGYLFSSKKQLLKSSEEIPEGNFCKALIQIAQKKDAYIVSGICERSGKDFYNSSILVRPNGRISVYRKLHLFDTEKFWFREGNLPLEVHAISSKSFGKVNIGMMICYDWRYPEVARTLALKGAQIICHPANLVMHYCQRAMFTRAIENRVFIITANRTGKEKNKNTQVRFTGSSVIINPEGKYLVRCDTLGAGVKTVFIEPKDALYKKTTARNNLFKDRREKYYRC